MCTYILVPRQSLIMDVFESDRYKDSVSKHRAVRDQGQIL